MTIDRVLPIWGRSFYVFMNFPQRIWRIQRKNDKIKGNRQIMMRSDIKLPQPFASWSNSL